MVAEDQSDWVVRQENDFNHAKFFWPSKQNKKNDAQKLSLYLKRAGPNTK